MGTDWDAHPDRSAPMLDPLSLHDGIQEYSIRRGGAMKRRRKKKSKHETVKAIEQRAVARFSRMFVLALAKVTIRDFGFTAEQIERLSNSISSELRGMVPHDDNERTDDTSLAGDAPQRVERGEDGRETA